MTPKNYGGERNFPNFVVCDNVHYILAVKTGVFSKLPNVGFRGRQELKYRDLASIYEKTMPSSEKSTDADMEESELTLRELRIRCQKERPGVVDVDLDEPLILLKQRTSSNSNPVRKRKRNTHKLNLERECEELPSTSGLISEDSSPSVRFSEVKEEAMDVDVLEPSPFINDTFLCSINKVYTIEDYESEKTESFSPDDSRSKTLLGVYDEIDMVEKSKAKSSCGQHPSVETEPEYEPEPEPEPSIEDEPQPSVETEDHICTPTELTSLTLDESIEIYNADEENFLGEVSFSQEINNQVDRVPEIVLSYQPVDVTKFTGSEECQPSNVTSDVEIDNSSAAEVHVEAEEHHLLKHPPIKLLSNRKALSPSTQEKLCQAVDGYDPVKSSGNGSDEKLTSSPQKGDAVLKLSGKRLFWFEGKPSGVLSSSEETDKKSNNRAAGPTKGILKLANAPMKKHAQEAITFSQRQMHDIESLATKLVNGLRSMKGIMEETLTSEESSSLVKVNNDKMRAAIDDASELEETTKKWLFMMGKDCNRFCKILQRSALQKATAEVRKDQKKITFADEAGGMLCQLAYAVVSDDGGTIVHLRWEKERVRARKFSAGVRRASTNSES